MTDTPEPEEVEAEPAPEPGSHQRTYDAPSSGAPPLSSSANAWALACHLAGLADFFNVFIGIGILVPLVIWLLKREDHPYIDAQGKEAVNFQINVAIWTLVAMALSCCLIGIPILFLLPIVETVLVILAAVETASGRPFRYPLTIRLLD